ncbi:G-type lectin S-receptor-like serine/threonine-protein kinase At2g19130 [Alnus glutinosa]|uniref:G-type lectin S-receptor-like serine/threonine-protein kinase At2g19130 n=1 Tax=Alnus glutinosa TaxID=3517 RepID=UPI002D767268|nr:G-type lectin S-receptor-like serine/threonine-protein kinase At2g19130 [Alnus glutinosa]
MTSKPWLLFVLLLILSYGRACFSISGDTLSPGHSLSLSKSETIVSQGGTFELGFFKPGSSLKIYLGIWYKMFDQKDNIVWVANRENPLSDLSSSRLDLSEDGNLLLFGGSSSIPFSLTNLTSPRSTEAVLGEDGNFVLRDKSNASSILWESFDHPTDTWLPGAKCWIDKATRKQHQLVSWKNSEDPSPGVFSVGLDPNGINQVCLQWNTSQIYWCSGAWNGNSFNLIPEMSLSSIYNFSIVSNEKGMYIIHYLRNPSYRSKLVMLSTGKLQLWTWLSGPLVWNSFWYKPRDPSDVYALCGGFGVYSGNSSSPICECLKGFEPFSIDYTRLNDWSGGCVRKSPLQCENNTYGNGTKDWFMKMPNVRLPVNSKAYWAESARINCEAACMNNCSCTAYAYNRSGYCMIWEGAIFNLQQLSDAGETGQYIYLKLAADENQSTKGKKWKVWVAVLVPSIGLILCLFICFSTKGKLKRVGEKASSNNLLLFDFDTELSVINEETNTNNNMKKKEKDFELPLFSYESISTATNNFSAVNKLGEGGYGPVYKVRNIFLMNVL